MTTTELIIAVVLLAAGPVVLLLMVAFLFACYDKLRPHLFNRRDKMQRRLSEIRKNLSGRS